MHTQSRTLKTLSLLLITAAAFFLNGCGGGSTGATGPAGTTPAAGSGGGVPGAAGTVSAAAMTPAQFAALAPVATVTGVTISSAPVVTFKVTDANGNPLIGLANASKSSTALVASYANFGFTLAKLVPGKNGSPSKWLSYLVTTVPNTTTALTATRPSTDNTGTLVDNGDGTYTYTFYRDITKVKDVVAGLTLTGNNVAADLGDLSYDPTLTHRLGIQIYGNAPGTGTNTPTAVQTTAAVPMQNPTNVTYDFIPATGKAVTATDTQRVLVDKSNCEECHAKIGGIPGTASQSGPHSGSRKDPRYCVTCHTEQIKYSVAAATSANYDFNGGAALVKTTTIGVFGNPSDAFASAKGITRTDGAADGVTLGYFPVFIHKIHMGEDLVKTGYNFVGQVAFNEIRFPQEKTDCIKCHDNTKAAQADNWKNVPNRLACGACHDGIDWAAGTGVTLADRDADVAAAKAVGTTASGHGGGKQTDDSGCAGCHKAADIPVSHAATTTTTHNQTLVSGVSSFSYEFASSNAVTLNSSKQPVFKFRILKDGAPVTLASFTSGTTMLANFDLVNVTLYIMYAVPQDQTTTPAEFNVRASVTLLNLGKGAGGNKLTGPDTSGFYTATLAQPSSGAAISIPANASMVTGVIYGRIIQSTVAGSTSTNVTVKPLLKQVLASGITGNTARRVIVSSAKCNDCHDQLGTNPGFHSGGYNDANACAFCHTPNRASSGGWAAVAKMHVHGIHGAKKRSVPFTWDGTSATDNFSMIGYPGILSNCEACHLPGTYDFSASQYTDALIGNMLYVTAAVGKPDLTSANASAWSVAPYPTTYPKLFTFKFDGIADYGTAPSTSNAGVLTAGSATNLVHSPIAAACFSCHDSSTAISHMAGAGGSIYDARGTAATKVEQCLVCHGPGKVAAIKDVHPKP